MYWPRKAAQGKKLHARVRARRKSSCGSTLGMVMVWYVHERPDSAQPKTMTRFPRIKEDYAYRTRYGRAFTGDALEFLKGLPEGSVDLVITSPPYALQRKKSYGNVGTDAYLEWFIPFANATRRILKDTGSFVVNIGGVWNKSSPTRSTYHFELAVKMVKECQFFLAQEFYWHNPARIPGPAEWVTVKRIRVKDSVEMIWWFSKTENPKASNRKVLKPYSEAMLSLLRNGYNHGVRPSGHDVSKKWWQKDNGGAIPPNFMGIESEDYETEGDLSSALQFPNTEANTPYQRMCKATGFKPHPARFPAALPEFFIKMLTDENDLVLDPFAGSNVTGSACERLKRKWLSVDLSEDFVRTSAFRFEEQIVESNIEIPRPDSCLILEQKKRPSASA